MDDLKLIAKSEEDLQKGYKQLKPLVMISTWNLDLKNVPRLHLREANKLTRKTSD
jgi:hypothetical protein